MTRATNTSVPNFIDMNDGELDQYQACILIKDTNMLEMEADYSPAHRVLATHFKDTKVLEYDDTPDPNEPHAPSKKDVIAIFDFVQKNIGNNVLAICSLGHSRSGFVSLVFDYLNNNLDDWACYDDSPYNLVNLNKEASPNQLQIKIALELGLFDPAIIDNLPVIS
ncbi:hypothetical protein [Fructobacillus ficulneus]|uniref:Tyrosine specific protein phosphatases domain-containing protein n=1 Tax=Fructobacillus ficulneus TaxID=157463 RepID=A0A0K8MFN9_9LACO|nr:hypothetical protein [Fructobacillus ficulneus]GAO99307.1 hypothetical protein FFIC_091340 [Fructobacillus ficulneus]